MRPPHPDRAPPAVVDLRDLLGTPGDGARWTLDGSGDLNANLVHLDPGQAIDRHVNDEVDVLVVVLRGGGRIHIDGSDHDLAGATIALAPRGAPRRIDTGAEGLDYLTVHLRRGRLGIGAAAPTADR